MLHIYYAQIAQLVEQRTENPRVAGSIPALGTFLLSKNLVSPVRFLWREARYAVFTRLRRNIVLRTMRPRCARI